MISVDYAYLFKMVSEKVDTTNELIKELISRGNPKDEMWDIQDMWQNWKVSRRTQSEWRKDGAIGYVQYGNKIWYPREAREAFIKANLIKAKGGVDDESK